ncbi:PTS system glucose-specific EIICBA component [compost metagenome]
MVGSALGGILLTLNHVLASSIGVGGIPGFLSIFPNQWLVFFAGMGIVLVVPFGLTVLYGKFSNRNKQADPAVTAERSVKAEPISEKTHSGANILEIRSPLTGTAVPLDQVPDPAFAQRQMGQGIAIEPTEGRVVAPFDGTVAHVIKSKHAVILQHATGLQILVHVGIDTVSLKGSGFTTHVQTGDEVKAGQLLIEFDMDAIRAAGLPLITPILIPDGQEIVEQIEEKPTGSVTINRDVILSIRLTS